MYILHFSGCTDTNIADLFHACYKIQLIFMLCFPTCGLLHPTNRLSKPLIGVNVCRLQKEGVKGGSKGRKGREGTMQWHDDDDETRVGEGKRE